MKDVAGLGVVAIALGLIALSFTGCRSLSTGGADASQPIALAEPEPAVTYVFLPGARVIRVNDTHRYVILECTTLPSAGEQAKVYRENERVATLTISAQRRGPFVSADIVEGDPRDGDMVKLKRAIPVSSEEEERP